MAGRKIFLSFFSCYLNTDKIVLIILVVVKNNKTILHGKIKKLTIEGRKTFNKEIAKTDYFYGSSLLKDKL